MSNSNRRSNKSHERGDGKSDQRSHKPYFISRCDDNNLTIDSAKFWRSIIQHSDKTEVLETIHRPTGIEAVKKAVNKTSYNDRSELELFLDFIGLLGDRELFSGLQRDAVITVCEALRNTTGLLRMLESKASILSSKSITALAWFVYVLIVHGKDETSELASFGRTILGKLTNPSSKRLLEAAMFKGSGVVSNLEHVGDLRDLEPIHDNDFPSDFRKVKVLPTVQEINAAPYKLNRVINTFFSDETVNADVYHLEKMFRLLREDFLRPLKEEIGKMVKDQSLHKYHLSAPRPIGVISMKSNTCCVAIALSPSEHLRKKLNKIAKKKELARFFEDDASKVLAIDSLVSFMDGKTVKYVGLIVARDCVMMAENWLKYKMITVGVQFEGVSLETVLQGLQSLERKRKGQPIAQIVIQSRISYFAYEPVLRRLQEQCVVNLHEEILKNVPVEMDIIPAIPKRIRQDLQSDPSQLAAVEYSLRHRLAIIQGPPGTGKTFVGVKLVQILLNNRSAKILCLCYTNHALDSFLESLMDSGIPEAQFVRFGSMSKISDRLKPRCFQQIQGQGFDRAESQTYFYLKELIEKAEKELPALTEPLMKIYPFTSRSWKQLQIFFRTDLDLMEYIQQFAVKSSRDGFRQVGRGGLEIQADHYFVLWCEGEAKPAELEYDVGPDQLDLWSLSRVERQQKLFEWYEAFQEFHSGQLATKMQQMNLYRKEMANLRERSKVSELTACRIIACTTTFAAKNRDLINSCRPNIVLVEEAAEIHESHILINLNDETTRLIMIGDHKQLRPKLQCYDLRTESHSRIDFDMSLFERLAVKGYPVAQLEVQHRMRPSISQLIRHTYPALKDHEKVKSRANILGVPVNLAFINHTEKEKNDSELLVTDTSSHSNLFEAQMVLKITKYLLQQGYEAADIVILTPYLGQLMLIRRLMAQSQELQAELAEKDQEEMQSLSSEDEENNPDNNRVVIEKKKKFIRIATIDNFQGEEAKIILASLVRSNETNEIGFVGTPERVNVLCSRARDGFYLIGNLEMFESAKTKTGRDTWEHVVQTLKSRNRVFEGFPIRCQNHAQYCPVIKTPQEFDTLCPHGGCQLPCEKVIQTCPLQHVCIRRCHPHVVNGRDIHDSLLCETEVEATCLRGQHTLKKRCGDPAPTFCLEQIKTRCELGHAIPHRCDQDPPPCKRCKELEESRGKGTGRSPRADS